MAMDASESHVAHLRVATFARARETEASNHYPLGIMNAQLSVISIHGETITEDYIERINLCEYCVERR